VHGSWLHEHPDGADGHNERLEFLGDAVVNLVVSEALHARHPRDDEGVLSARRSAIVSEAGLAIVARRIDLGAYLSLGEGESQRGARHRPALLASAFEAIAGAIFLGCGWQVVRDLVLDLVAPELEDDAPVGALKNPKSRLQEMTQRASGERPVYEVIRVSGPDHQREFTVEVAVAGAIVGRGAGPSRQKAEVAAAERAVASIAAARAAATSAAVEAERVAGAVAAAEPDATAAAETGADPISREPVTSEDGTAGS
jgi:ribonuclease III